MNAEELARYRAQLSAMRREVIGLGDASIEPNRVDASTKLDEDAQALNEMSQIIASRQNRARIGSLAQIDAALRRIELDPEFFGHCLDCEEPIAGGRLRLMPFAEYCVECQAKRDVGRSAGRRSLTDFGAES